MSWKGILSIAATCLVAGVVVGLVLGLRGCGGGASKLLQENAELKAEVTQHKFDAAEAAVVRLQHAEARNDAELELAARVELAAASADTVRRLRGRVAKAGRERDERDSLIEALDEENGGLLMNNGLLELALESARLELEAVDVGEAAWKSALATSEKRADKLENYVAKEKKRLIWSNIGSALGASLITLGAVAVAR